MLKKVTAICLVVCLFGLILCACGKEPISSEEAYQVVLADLGEKAALAKEPHIHESTHKNKPCYNIFVTVGEESLVYIVSQTGEIIYQGIGGHSH